MVTHGRIAVVVGIDLPHVISIGGRTGENDGSTGLHQVHIIIESIVDMSTIGHFLPHEDMTVGGTHDAQLAVGHGATREAIARREIFCEEHGTTACRHTDIIINAYLGLSVALTVILTHTDASIFEVACPFIHKDIIDEGSCTSGAYDFYAQCELVGII